ncbi:MAG: hypothetical protein DSY90_11495 [Deltaproteobacteria bacterium]|nr:MAG: hypothetical protein DSY90_11495 [Deltaproteobacteria bacterium]
MEPLTDERIMAYVDGELTPEEAAEVRALIQNNPEALKQVDIFSHSAAMLQGVYDAPLTDAIPDRLIDTVQNYQPDAPPKKITARIWNFLESGLHWPRWSPGYGLALSAALLLGISAGYLAARRVSPPGRIDTTLFSGEKFSQGLETTRSGQMFSLADGTIHITPVATFKDRAHQYCRQYEIISDESEKHGFSQGIACRTASGQWRAFIQMAAAPDQLPSRANTDYVPAGHDDDLFETVLEKTMATPPLTLDQESALIEHAWR